MSRFLKLPDNLKSWKVNSLVSDESGNKLYKVSKKDYDGTLINGFLRHIYSYEEAYNENNIEYLQAEADFLSSICKLGNFTNYTEICANNNSAKEKYDLYILTENLQSFDELMKSKAFSDSEIIDFGIQISGILESLEAKNIFHGNLCPSNIFVTNDGKYKIGGFSDFESKISDLSYIAPEIFKKEKTDFTTDIYSLGLIMYSLCNNKKLPFENETGSKKSATEERLDGKQISVPENGNEKLKSVILIACQSKNENRWKNAGNIKNALVSIQSEIPCAPSAPSADVIPAENTDFEENVFEEFDFSQPENSASDTPSVVPTAVSAAVTAAAVTADITPENTDTAENNSTAEDISQDVNTNATEEANSLDNAANESNSDSDLESEFEVVEVTSVADNADDKSDNGDNNTEETPAQTDAENFDSIAESEDNFDEDGLTATTDNLVSDGENTENNKTVEENVLQSDSEEIKDDVFDNFEVSRPDVKSDKNTENTNKDYGDFFEDGSDNSSLKQDDKELKKTDDFDNDETAEEESNAEEENLPNKKKKNAAVIAVNIIVMVAALGFIAFCIISGISKNNEKSKQSAAQNTTTAETTVSSTKQPTTAKATTQPTSKASSKENVVQVVGYGYSYGKKLLEENGFVVKTGEYKYSTIYDAGYVIAQTPDGNTSADKGSVVTLDISLGKSVPQTTQAPQSSKSDASSKQGSSSSQASKTSEKTSSGYLFSNSDSSYLSKSDVSSLNRDTLNLALNEIYARRGRIFKDSYLSSYFNSKSWYTPKYTSDEFSKNVTFNKYEQANLQLMIQEQKDKGYR